MLTGLAPIAGSGVGNKVQHVLYACSFLAALFLQVDVMILKIGIPTLMSLMVTKALTERAGPQKNQALKP